MGELQGALYVPKIRDSKHTTAGVHEGLKMKIVCDACGAKYSIADEKVAGKVFKIRCKKCSNIIVVRGNANEEAGAAAAPAEEPQPNKDTKVFDYQGYDSPQDAMADEGEWHLVIDQEQVGPMTSAEVRQRFAAGDVDTESYIWKEGFADWERLPDVPEFADLEGGQAGGAGLGGGGGMFGDSDPMPEATTEAPAPAGGVLAAAAASSDLFGGGASGGADLFGGGGGASEGADLFGGGSSSVGDNTGEIPMSKEAEAQLKGQRNENSVLFSLGNLAALASDSPKAATAAPAVSSGGGGISNTGGSEGSGLIDIRSMASVYLADKGGAGGGGSSTPTGSADDLPVFSQSAFESASPVLLPTQSSGTDNKVLYALVGVIAALVVAAAILIVVVLKGGDDKEGGEVASAEGAATVEGGDDAPKTDPAAAAEGTETETDDPETADPAETGDPETADPSEAADPEETADPVEPKETSSAGSSRSDKRKERESKAKTRDAKTPTTRPDPKPEADTGGSCDEVTCLVDPGKACCKKYNKKSSSSSSSSSSSNSNLPESPSRSDITKGIGAVRGRVTSCGDKHGGKGTVKVKIKIGSNGKVQSAAASGGGSELRSCVASAVKRASFPKTQKGVSVTYPFVFR